MKKYIIIGAFLAIVGGAYGWWWNQPIRQFAELAMQGGRGPQDWTELRNQYPQLARAFRIAGIDPFVQATQNSSDSATAVAQRLWGMAGRHSALGLLFAVSGLVVMIVAVIKGSMKRKSEPVC